MSTTDDGIRPGQSRSPPWARIMKFPRTRLRPCPRTTSWGLNTRCRPPFCLKRHQASQRYTEMRHYNPSPTSMRLPKALSAKVAGQLAAKKAVASPVVEFTQEEVSTKGALFDSFKEKFNEVFWTPSAHETSDSSMNPPRPSPGSRKPRKPSRRRIRSRARSRYRSPVLTWRAKRSRRSTPSGWTSTGQSTSRAATRRRISSSTPRGLIGRSARA